MKKKIFILLFAIIAMPFYINGEELDVVANDGFATLDNTLLDSTNNNEKSEFVADLRVNEDRNVNGIFFAAGDEVTIDGQSEYGIFAGNNVKINSSVEKDLFVGGNIVKVNANIVRDSYIAGSIVDLNGVYEGNIYLAGDTVTLENVVVNGDLKIYASNLTIGENVVLNNFKYNDNCDVINLDKVQANVTETYTGLAEKINTKKAIDYVKDFVRTTLSLLIIAYIIYFAFPSLYEKLDKKLEVNPLMKKASVGLALLFLIPIISIIAMFTIIALPASLLVLVIYVIVLYLSKLVIISVIGSNINTKLFKNKKDNAYLSLLLGIVVYELLILIPYLGTVVEILAIIIGIGYIKEKLFPKKNNK